MGSFFSHEVLLGIIVIALWVAAAKWDEYRFRKDAVRRLQDAINIGAANDPNVDVNDLFTQIAQTTTLCAPAAALAQRDWVLGMVVFPDESPSIGECDDCGAWYLVHSRTDHNAETGQCWACSPWTVKTVSWPQWQAYLRGE